MRKNANTTTKRNAESNALIASNPIYLEPCGFYGKSDGPLLFNADAVINAITSDGGLHWGNLLVDYDHHVQRMLSGWGDISEEEAKFLALTAMLAEAYHHEDIKPATSNPVAAARAWADGYEMGLAASKAAMTQSDYVKALRSAADEAEKRRAPGSLG